MKNVLYAIVFCVITFFMWLSLMFSLADRLYGEDVLFESNAKAFVTYGISIFLSLVATVGTYYIIALIT